MLLAAMNTIGNQIQGVAAAESGNNILVVGAALLLLLALMAMGKELLKLLLILGAIVGLIWFAGTLGHMFPAIKPF